MRHARGTRETLVLDRVRKQDVVRRGDELVTAGWRGAASRAYPKGIPIGEVTSVGQTDTDLYQQVQVDPYVDFGGSRLRARARPAGPATMTAGLTIRGLAVVFVAALFQAGLFASLAVVGGTPDLLLIAVVSLGLLRGSVPGAVFGFAGGLVLDLFSDAGDARRSRRPSAPSETRRRRRRNTASRRPTPYPGQPYGAHPAIRRAVPRSAG